MRVERVGCTGGERGRWGIETQTDPVARVKLVILPEKLPVWRSSICEGDGARGHVVAGDASGNQANVDPDPRPKQRKHIHLQIEET